LRDLAPGRDARAALQGRSLKGCHQEVTTFRQEAVLPYGRLICIDV
jgi:hypothetical protein